MVRNHASQLCVAAPFPKGILKFSGRIIGKGGLAQLPEPSENSEYRNLTEEQHGEGDPCQIHNEIGERAYPERNKGLLDLISDTNGRGDEPDKKVTGSRPLAAVDVQGQKKEDSQDSIKGHMKQAEGIEGIDEKDQGRAGPQINAGYINSRDKEIIGIHFYKTFPDPGRRMEPA
jgi:hypothetical protein